MFYGGDEYSTKEAPSPDEDQMNLDQTLSGEENDDVQLESVYSYDSALDEADDEDEVDDDEPFDKRTRNYLEAHAEELNLPMRCPKQQYADLKVREVLSRGTVTMRKEKRMQDKIRETLPCHKIETPDYQEAKNLLNKVNSFMNSDEKPTSNLEIFNRSLAFVRDDMDETTVEFVEEYEPSGSNLRIGGGENDIVDVRQLVIALVSSSSEEEVDTNVEGSSEEESLNFEPFRGIDFLLPDKDEEWLFTPNLEGLKIDNTLNEAKTSIADRLDAQEPHSNHGTNKLSRCTQSSMKEYEKKCSSIQSVEEQKISEKRRIIVFKELLFRILNHRVVVMSRNRDMMKEKLFQIWILRQIDGLDKMKRDIDSRNLRLMHRIQRVQKQNKCNNTVKGDVEEENGEPITTFKMQDDENRRWKRTIQCMREREKISIDVQGNHFIAGLLTDRSEIKTVGDLSKVWAETPSFFDVPPPPPRMNNNILTILSNFAQSRQPLITYGDFLRMVEGDISFIDRDEYEEGTDDAKQNQPVLNSSANFNAKHGFRPICREWFEFIKKDRDIDSPFLTNREFKNYMKMLNDKFFPDPNFKVIEETILTDRNALIFQVPGLMRMNCSLEDVDDTLKYYNGGLKCAESRGIYFFQYKPEWTPKDIQAAYEQYIFDNEGLEEGPHERLSGCLLIYKNVKLAVVMIEGQADHLYNHFALFRNSLLYKLIDFGRVLETSERVTCILDQWVSIVTEQPPGEITYQTESKKVLYRIAEPRLHSFKRKLYDLYSYLASEVNSEPSIARNEREMAIPANLKSQIDPCRCLKSELNEKKSELKILGHDDKVDSKIFFSAQELLPPPALVSYLLKYKKLKCIVKFIDDFVMQPYIDSEDEKYNLIEDAILNKYIDSGDEQDKPQLIKEIKRACKEREIISKCQYELNEALEKEKAGTDKPPWAKSYDSSMFSPQLVNVQVRKNGKSRSAIHITPLIDSDKELEKTDEDERYVILNHGQEEISAKRRFINFIDTGDESWLKKVKRFGLKGRQVKQMLQDARKYKQLRKIMNIQDDIESVQPEASVEGEESNSTICEEEERDEDKEVDEESRVSFLPDTMSEIERLLTEMEEKRHEFCEDENMEWPFLTRFERIGEFMEGFGEEGPIGDFPLFKWDYGLDQAQPLVPVVELRSEHTQLGSSGTGESLLDNTATLDEEGIIPDAPPASSVTDASTDP